MKNFKKMKFLWAFFVFPIVGLAQDKGIQFEHGLNWDEVQAKAKAENKYIFVDCFATWCGPCKAMDKEVYPLDTVGNYFNKKFICIKLQLDSTKADNEETKSWYADARRMVQQYKISAFPSFLFFSPDGKMVHKGIGYKGTLEFMELGTDAINPVKQYYTLLEKYNKGEKDPKAMVFLANMAGSLNEQQDEKRISQDYIQHYLFKLKEEALYTRDNLNFIRAFTQTSNDPGFKILYNNAGKIDKLMDDPAFVEGYVNWIIAKEEIDPIIFPAGKTPPISVDWNKIRATIVKKYNTSYADYSTTGAKIRWYGWKKDWPEFARNTAIFLEKYNSNMSPFDMNTKLWDIFQHSTKKEELIVAIKLEKEYLQKNPEDANAMDTYANLLYKMGNKQDALTWEEKSTKLAQDSKEIQANYAKMKMDRPTW